VRREVLVFGQVPLAVGNPVLAARAVPALRLRRVGGLARLNWFTGFYHLHYQTSYRYCRFPT
jgi:hypothetical protein